MTKNNENHKTHTRIQILNQENDPNIENKLNLYQIHVFRLELLNKMNPNTEKRSNPFWCIIIQISKKTTSNSKK